MQKHNEGFTLIELLIVIAIIGFLAAAILVAVDPVRRIEEARDARRSAEVNAILNAVLNYQVDNRALYNSATTPVVQHATNNQMIIGNGVAATMTCADTANLCTGVTMDVTGTAPCRVDLYGLVDEYIAEIPVDPEGGSYTSQTTGYYFRRTGNGRITVGACNPERPGVTIKVTR